MATTGSEAQTVSLKYSRCNNNRKRQPPHKQIARELGVSHHTVRNQLAHLYRKLDLHNKASLAQYLAANQVST
jgi:FixJ family two-component response regulator